MMAPDLFMLLCALAGYALVMLTARYGPGASGAWARSVAQWSGLLLGAMTLLTVGSWIARNDTLDFERLGRMIAGMLLASLCFGGGFQTGAFVAEHVGRRAGLNTWTTQALSVGASVVGTISGFFLYAVFLWGAHERSAPWESEGLARMFDSISLWLSASAALLVALVRMVYALRLESVETDRARLAAENTSARLAQLEARLRPHFLLNALSGLAGLIHDAPDRAEAMTLALAHLLQRSLDGSDAPTTPLRDELALVRAYLDVEQPRFGDRLQVAFHVEDATLDALVPRLTLQPLVENAIKHGLGKTDQTVHISVTALRDGPRLHLAVSDDGPAFPDDLTGGHGLTSVTERLMLLYSDRFTLQFVNAATHTAKHVRIALPYTPALPALAR